ncbi:hypothetical protein ES707_18586 [subsurface metagenome]
MEVKRRKSDPALVDLPDGGDICGDLDALFDPVFQFPGVPGRFSLEFVDEEVGIDVCDVVGVSNIVSENIQVKICFLVCYLKPPVKHSPQDAGPDLPADRLEERALFGGEGFPVPAPDKERPDNLGLDDKRDTGKCGKPEFPEETGGGGALVPIMLKVVGKAGGESAGARLSQNAPRPFQEQLRHVPPALESDLPVSGTEAVDCTAVVAEEVERLVERRLHQFAGCSSRCGCADDPVQQQEMPVPCLQLLLRVFPVSDIPHNDLDRRPALKKRPCASPLDGDHRPVEPDNQQFDERRLLPLQVMRAECPDGIPGLGVDDIKDSLPDNLLRA